jgi:cytidylate kinase
MSGPVIAIDGPAGSGKSTLAGAVARRLGYRHLDTGAMYRAVTLLALRAGAVEDAEAAAALARKMDLQLGKVVVVDGEDVTGAIRLPDVDAAVSVVAAHPAVRAELVTRQRQWASDGDGVVVEGRDIGSVVFPEAPLKIYLTAHPEERARRRAEQVPVSARTEVGDAVASLARRDHLDSSRSASPLLVPDGAIVVDSTGRSVEEVVEEVLSYL